MSLPSPQSTQKFSIREAARFLNISTKTLRRWEKQGILVAERTPGNQRRYPLSQLENFSPKPLPRTPISPSPLLTSDFSPFRLSKFQKGLIFSSILLGITAASLLAINQAGTNILPLDQVVASIREFITFGETAENNREYNPVQLPPGLVLAESTSAKDLLFHISVPTLIDSTATVSGDLTAPNIIYGIRTGPGINVSLGQTPTVSNTGVLSFQGQTGTVNLTAGSGISISGTTIASTVSSGNAFKTIAVSGQNDVTAGSSGDTLTFAGGSGIGLTTSSSDKKVTIGVSTITPTLGGTGLTTYTTGDILYASAANTLSKLAIGSSNQILAVSGGIPSWADNSSGGWTSASDNLYPTTTSDRIIIGGNTSTVHQLEVSGAITGKSLVSFNETGDQYILTASASGVEKFSITNAGGISLGGSVGSGSLCLLGGATASFGSCSDTASPNYWQLGTGTLAPGNLTQSTIFGDTATSSASLRALIGGSITGGQASLIVNQFESQDIFAASASGTTKFTIASDGSFTIPAQTAASTITSTQTTGNVLSMANASSSQTDDTLVNVSQTGVTTGYTGNLVNINSSSTTGAAKFLNLAADSSTVGTLLNLSGNALTSGAGIAVGSTSTGLTGSLLSLTSGSTAAVTNGIFYLSATGAHSGAAAKITTAATAGTGLSIADSSSSQTTTTILDIAQTGVTTGYTGNVVNFSGTATTGSGFNIVNITSNAINGTGTGLNVNSSTTGALTSGLERINASAAHTGTAWQLLSGTQTGGAGSINLSAVTTGTGLNINTSNNTWTTGSLLYANSTATSLTTGLLGNFSWKPSTVP